MDFEELKEKNLLTLSPSGFVCIIPHDQYSFTTYPINDINDGILLTQDEYIGIIERRYMFNESLNGVVDYIAPPEEEEGE